MAWEERNGRRYYYRSRRVGKQVIREYVGTGRIGELAENADRIDQARKQSERQAQRQERAQFEKVETEAKRIERYTRLLTRAALLLAGYHPHKGQWRKRTDGKG